tara:strand:- start:1257 stop:1829 length:573 start_codon:yes stop_codon:yes gene_type:complete
MGLDMYLSVQFEAPAYERITSEVDVISHAAKNTMEALGIAWGECDPKTGETNPKALAVHTDCSWFTVSLPFAYWRKANAIHDYIIQKHANGIDQCQEIELETEDIVEFIAVLKKVIDAKGDDKEKIYEELLPTAQGFFFGGTEYDEWYIENAKYTLERFESLLTYIREVSDHEKWGSSKKVNRIIYRASW